MPALLLPQRALAQPVSTRPVITVQSSSAVNMLTTCCTCAWAPATICCPAPLRLCAIMHRSTRSCAALRLLAHACATGATCFANDPMLQLLGCRTRVAHSIVLLPWAVVCRHVLICHSAAEPARAALLGAAAAPLLGCAVLLRPVVPCCPTFLPCVALC